VKNPAGQEPLLLAGDVGGTKTDLAIFSPGAGARAPLAQARYPSEQYTGLGHMAREFLAKTGLRAAYACFDVAGPVVDGRAHLTNLPWEVDESALAEALNLTAVRLVNDLVAVAHAVPSLVPEDLVTLNTGQPAPRGAIAVLAPGTGLGEAYLTWAGSGYRAHPSEGGHADFAPADEVQMDLLAYLRPRLDHVSVERVCSGIGIPLLYDFFQDGGRAVETPEAAGQLAGAADRTRVILEIALDPKSPSPLCRAVVDTFVAILGAEAGNLVLKVLATGGLYMAGGIPAHILPALQGERFMQAFVRKGRFASLLAQVPVHVIVNPRVALLGAAAYGLELLRTRGVDGPMRT
jgi:glucokinase